MRFRTSHNNSEGDAKGHTSCDPDVANNGANTTTKIWKVATPTAEIWQPTVSTLMML